MVIVAGRIPINPALRDQAVAAFLKMAAATKPEQGCVQYDFYSDLADENMMHVYEEWTRQEDLDAHMKTQHMTEFREIFPKLLGGETAFSVHITVDTPKA